MSPETIAATMDLDAASSEIQASDGQNYPQINGLASAGASHIFSAGGGTYPQGSTFLELRQNIWGRLFDAQTRLRKAEYEDRKAAVATTQTNMMRKFAMLYIDWINTCESDRVYSNQVKLMEKIIELSSKRIARGDDTRLTLQQGRIRLLNSEAQVRLVRIRSAAISQRLALAAHDNSPEIASSEELDSVFSALLKTLPKDSVYFGHEAREKRLAVQDANVELSKNSFGPRLDFVARGGVTNYATNTSFTYSGKTLVPEVDLGLELTVPIYDGSTHSHSLRAALQRRNAVEERNKAELTATKEQIIETTASQQISENAKSTYEEVAKIAAERAVALQTQLKYGSNTMFELLTASEELLQAERQRVADLQTLLQAKVDLAVSTNRLTLEALEKLDKQGAKR